MKKAQGLSMNVIIIAAIALLVLVILAVLILKADKEQDCADDGSCVLADMEEFEQEKFKCYRATDSKLACRAGCEEMYSLVGESARLASDCVEWCNDRYVCEK